MPFFMSDRPRARLGAPAALRVLVAPWLTAAPRVLAVSLAAAVFANVIPATAARDDASVVGDGQNVRSGPDGAAAGSPWLGRAAMSAAAGVGTGDAAPVAVGARLAQATTGAGPEQPASQPTSAATPPGSVPAVPSKDGPTVELNRLEDAGGGCRVTLVVANPGGQRFEQLKLDLVLFDGDGIVARRLAVETGPIRANKTVVRLFEAADLPCAGIGRLLLNDVAACASEAGPLAGCLDRLATASRAAVPFDQ